MNDKSVGFTIIKNRKVFEINFNRFFLTIEPGLNVDFRASRLKLNSVNSAMPLRIIFAPQMINRSGVSFIIIFSKVDFILIFSLYSLTG